MGRYVYTSSFEVSFESVRGMTYEEQAGSCLSDRDKAGYQQDNSHIIGYGLQCSVDNHFIDFKLLSFEFHSLKCVVRDIFSNLYFLVTLYSVCFSFNDVKSFCNLFPNRNYQQIVFESLKA